MLRETDIGPLCTADAGRHLYHQVERAVAAGGKIRVGGQHIYRSGYFYEPTVIVDLLPNADIAQEEFFGPVAVVFRVPSAEAALALANACPFGLGSSVWTKDECEADFFVDHLHCGITAVNSIVASGPRLPFGGVKRSRYSSELSDLAMREFVNVKTVTGR